MNFLKKTIFNIIGQEAKNLNTNAYVIGGYVRDSLLGRNNTDIDIVVEGSGINLASAVAKKLGVKVNIFKSFGTAMLKYKGDEIEFVGARKESYRRNSRNPIVEDGTLEEDRERRDFTINAMSFSLQEENFGELMDPFHGISDLNLGLIRTPLDPDTTYSDDPLRMIRAIRFATQLNFVIVPESLESIKKNADRLSILSVERITEELHKIMCSDNPAKGFKLLDQTTLLEKIIPKLTALKGVETVDGRGHKENFHHSLKVLENLCKNSDNEWLRWAALLHDIGKARTKKFEPGIGWTFHSHDFVGSKMIPEVFKRLKMPLNDKMKYVQKIVRLHMRPIALVEDNVSDSAVRRLLFDAGDDIDDLMTLSEADITSKNDKTVALHKNNFKMVRKKIIEVEEKDSIRNFQPPITGEIIMKTYNITPGREIGLFKERIKNAILDGEIPNEYDAAFAYMEKIAPEILEK